MQTHSIYRSFAQRFLRELLNMEGKKSTFSAGSKDDFNNLTYKLIEELLNKIGDYIKGKDVQVLDVRLLEKWLEENSTNISNIVDLKETIESTVIFSENIRKTAKTIWISCFPEKYRGFPVNRQRIYSCIIEDRIQACKQCQNNPIMSDLCCAEHSRVKTVRNKCSLTTLIEYYMQKKIKKPFQIQPSFLGMFSIILQQILRKYIKYEIKNNKNNKIMPGVFTLENYRAWLLAMNS